MTTPKPLPTDLIDSLLTDYKKPEDLIGENDLFSQLTKALVERALQAEMTEYLGRDKHETVASSTGNTRNGKSRKTLKGEFGWLYAVVCIELAIPRGLATGLFIPDLAFYSLPPIRHFPCHILHSKYDQETEYGEGSYSYELALSASEVQRYNNQRRQYAKYNYNRDTHTF